MEKMGGMYISLQETMMNMQIELYACKERELTIEHKMEMQELEIKAFGRRTTCNEEHDY